MAAPIPRVPPVTKATLPSSLSPVLVERSCVAVMASSPGAARLTLGPRAWSGGCWPHRVPHGRPLAQHPGNGRHRQRSPNRTGSSVLTAGADETSDGHRLDLEGHLRIQTAPVERLLL